MNKNEKEIIDTYEMNDTGLPYPVTILNAVERVQRRGQEGFRIPNLKALLERIAVVRCALPNRLIGPEIKFVANVLGVSGKKMAEMLSVTPETMSRWINDERSMPELAERMLKLIVLTTFARDELENPMAILQQARRDRFTDQNYPNFVFEFKANDRDEVWQGVEEAA